VLGAESRIGSFFWLLFVDPIVVILILHPAFKAGLSAAAGLDPVHVGVICHAAGAIAPLPAIRPAFFTANGGVSAAYFDVLVHFAVS